MGPSARRPATSLRLSRDYGSRRFFPRNFDRAMAEKAPMRALLYARETESDDGGQCDSEPGSGDDYRPTPKPFLRLRCFACAGSGKLWITDENSPRGRPARCVACRGMGRVDVR